MYLDKKIPIIVLNYNDYDTAKAFILRFKEKLKNVAELIFVDNNSTDGSFERLKSEYEALGVFIRNDKNLGYGAGNNVGLRYVADKNYKRVIVANPDIIIEPEVIIKLDKLMEEQDKVKIAAPKMLDVNGHEQVSAWKLQGIIRDGFSSMIITNRIFKLDKKRYSARERAKSKLYVEAINGSFFMADLKAFSKIGFFDEDTFLYCEENILGFKLKKAGYKELLVNDLSYIHAHNATIGKIYKNKVKRYKLLQDSRRIYYKKYLKCSKFEILLFNLMSTVGLLERKLVDKLPLR